MLTMRLRAKDREIVCVGSSVAAIKAVHGAPPDLMILDLTLVDEDPFNSIRDGFGVLGWLRRSLPDVEFPVIVYTSDKSPNVDVQAHDNGVFRVLRKTRDVSGLIEAVCQALNMREAA